MPQQDETNPSGPQIPLPMHTPPVHPGAIPRVVERGSTWPDVIGITTIAIGCLGILSNSCNAIWPLTMRLLRGTGLLQAAPVESAFSAVTKYQWFVAAMGISGIALAILLIVVGVRIKNRRASAFRLMWFWIWARSFVVLLSSVIGYLSQRDQFAAQAATMPRGMPQEMMVLMAVGGVLMGVLFGLAYPIFLAVWFTRSNVREQTAAWKD